MSSAKEKMRMFIPNRYLEKFFSVDANGRELSLGDFISLQRKRRKKKEEIVGATAKQQRSRVIDDDPEPVFNRRQIEKLVDQYLESMDSRVVLEIEGKALTAEELKAAVRDKTSIGEQFVAMILSDRLYMELQIRQNNYDLEGDNQ